MNRIYTLLILCSLLSCQRQWHLAEVDPDTYRFDRYNSVKEDPEIKSMIQPYKSQLDAEMNQIIGTVKHDLTKAKPESTLGNFLSDLLVVQGEACSGETIDFAAQNYGGIRVPSVPAGKINRGKIFEIMPFENMLSVLEVKGNVLIQLINKMAESGGWPISKQLNFVIDNDKPTNITIRGEAFDMNKRYRIVLPDYIANGGDNCDFLIDQKRLPCDISIRDAIIKHILEMTERGEEIEAQKTGRITKS